MICLITEGYTDQLGVTQTNKLKYYGIKPLLPIVRLLKLPEQKERLEKNALTLNGKEGTFKPVMLILWK